MQLRYTKNDGMQMVFELGERPITLGRSPDADVVLLDERASRLHCGIRFWDGDFYIKDLKSRNGTYVNGEKIDVAKIGAGDRIKVGSTRLVFEQDSPGTATVLHEVEEQMSGGKGYSTILREIVTESEEPAPAKKKPDSLLESDAQPIRIKIRKKKKG